MQQITAFQYLKDTIKYFFSPKQYIGKVYFINNRKRKIIAETCYSVLFDGEKESRPKAFLKTLQKPKPNPYKKQIK